ncbi:hypothetical protein ACS0TY_026694 [Phlomoides rotata]
MEDKWRKTKWRGSMSFLFLSFEPISINTATIKPCYTAAASPSLRRRRAPCTAATSPNSVAAARPQLLRPSQPPNRPSTGGNHTKQVVQHLPTSPSTSLDFINHHSNPKVNPITPLSISEINQASKYLPPQLSAPAKKPQARNTHRDPKLLNLCLEKALEFYYWVETHFGFQHNEQTCKEMALVLVRGNRMNLF